MTDTISARVQGCKICHRVKHKNAKPYGVLQVVPTPWEWAKRNFFQVSHVKIKYDAVATVIDPLTKRARCIPVTEAYLTV